MKLKSLLFFLCMGLMSLSFAVQLHVNPKANQASQKSISEELTYPGYCQIEIINDSTMDLWVSGTYDDGSYIGFDVYRFDAPHYISLYYDAYCHRGMYLTIQSPYGLIYSGWTNVDSTLHVVSNLDKRATVEKSVRK